MVAKPRLRRWQLGVAVAVLLIVVLPSVVLAWSEFLLRSRASIPPHPFVIPAASPALVALGRHQAIIHGCTDCHGENLGGRVFLEDRAIGRIIAPNLTRGARQGALTDEQWELAVRHGISKDGAALKIMPSAEYQGISDEEIAAMALYARNLPPVVHSLPRTSVGPIARILLVAGKIPFLPARQMTHSISHPARVDPAASAEYGRYLSPSCGGCHGESFSGGPMPGMPPGAPKPSNITSDHETGIGDWTEADFVHAMRSGLRPDGSDFDTLAMPIAASRELSDIEAQALYRFLRTVPAKRYGSR